MSANETNAECLRPGDRIRRGHLVFDLQRVAVADQAPVQLEVLRVTRVGAASLPEPLTIAFGEIVQRVVT